MVVFLSDPRVIYNTLALANRVHNYLHTVTYAVAGLLHTSNGHWLSVTEVRRRLLDLLLCRFSFIADHCLHFVQASVGSCIIRSINERLSKRYSLEDKLTHDQM